MMNDFICYGTIYKEEIEMERNLLTGSNKMDSLGYNVGHIRREDVSRETKI